MTKEQFESIGYSGLNPRHIAGEFGVSVMAAIEAAGSLPAGVTFGVSEVSVADQVWDFPIGVSTVFEFLGEHGGERFLGFYHVTREATQYKGTFSTADVQSSGPARSPIAKALGYNPDNVVQISKPAGIDFREGATYFKPIVQRSGMRRPTAPGGTSVQINTYQPRGPRN